MWPALAVIGGVDRGMRMGGRCVQKQTSRKATILGVLKEGSLCAKVLWDDSDATIRCIIVTITNFPTDEFPHLQDKYIMQFVLSFSDATLSSLEPVEPPAFDAARLDGISALLLHDLMKLTFISDEKLTSNPLYPRLRVVEKKKLPSPDRQPSSHKIQDNIEMAKLEKKLDADIAMVLGCE